MDGPLPYRPVSSADHDFRTRLTSCAIHLREAIDARQASGAVALEISFSASDRGELSLAFEACSEVADIWQPEPGRELILSLSADLTRTTPAMFADQVEWLDRRLAGRPHICLSVFPCNGAETGLAAAEFALMAGAQRVEGRLLGRDERAGDICLTTLAARLRFDPSSGQPPAPPAARAGSLLAASIDQVMAERGLDVPAGLRTEFADAMRALFGSSGEDAGADEIWDAFEVEYMLREPASVLLLRCAAGRPRMGLTFPWITLFSMRQSLCATANNPALIVAGSLAAIGLEVAIASRHSHQLEPDGRTIAYVECAGNFPVWGVGIGGDLASASLKAVLSAVSRVGEGEGNGRDRGDFLARQSGMYCRG